MKSKNKLTLSLLFLAVVGGIVASFAHGKGVALIANADFYLTDLLLVVPLLLFISRLIYLAVKKNRLNGQNFNYTREIDPKWGLCGLFSLFGFLGFFSYSLDQTFFPFFFFVFIGFFGFYYEGKMSHVLKDEMYQQHLLKAKIKAMNIGLKGIYLGSLFCVMVIQKVEIAVPFMIAMVSILVGLSRFLESYFLYRYERVEEK